VAAPLVEPAHQAPRLRLEFGDIKRAYAKLIFPAPGETTGLDPILGVARRVLSDGRSCRLYRQVQEQAKLVDDFAVITETGPREGIILVDLETTPDRLAQAISATSTVLDALGREGCTEAELQRAITRVSRSFIFGAETIQGQAATLGHHDVNDDLPGAFNYPERVAAVTLTDVRAFCRSIFRLGNLSVVIYLPEGTDPQAHGIPTDAGALDLLLAKLLDDPAEVTLPTPPAAAAPKSAHGRGRSLTSPTPPRFETAHLSNGVEVCYRVDRAVPVLTMSLCSYGGATVETSANAGLSALTQVVQVKGAGDLSAEALHEILEGVGASLSPQADRDYSGLFVSALSGRLDEAFALLGQTIAEPRFDPDEIAQEKRLALEQLAAVEDSPVQAAVLRMRHLMYGDHPYGRPLPGTTSSIPAHTRDGLLARHRQNWTADRLQIVASGNLDPDDLMARLEKLVGALPGGGKATCPTLDPARPPEGVVSESMIRQQNQSVVLVAWPGPPDTSVDRVPLMLLKEVLNGQSGRLFETLRNQQSLCYNTGAMSTAGFGQGLFMGYVLTAPDTATQAREALVHEIVGLRDALVTEVEFERARAELLGHLLIGSQANSARVSRAAQDRIYGREANNLENLIAEIRQCTADQIQDVAQRMLTPDARYEVSLGPETTPK